MFGQGNPRRATWAPLRLAVVLCAIILGVVPAQSMAGEQTDPGSIETFTYGEGDQQYKYIVYTPTSYDPGRAAPLLVMAHGCQTTADEQMRASLFNPIAEREGFVVLYPDVTTLHEQQPGPLRNCWHFPLATSQHRDAGDAGAIAGMTTTVMEGWNVDAERVYMVGISAGGFMTSIMAAAYPDLYAAVGVIAAGAYADGSCLLGAPGIPAAASAELAYAEMGERARVIPRLVMGGDADQGIVPACADKALEQGLRTNNLVLGDSQESPISLTPASTRLEPKADGYDTTVSTYLDPDGCLIGERWLVHGMNHFWPGGSPDPDLANFTDPKGPNGAEASWAFLSRYTKSETTPPCTEAPDPDLSCASARNGTLPGTIVAEAGVRTLGTRDDDVILGTHGRDRIRGRGGSDLICAGAGDDSLKGGRGADEIHGRTGNDRIDGGGDKDRCRGGRGRDTLEDCE
ncbi:MAG TPA: PHB depolymerase family esterase [Solirubrobacterales bacterium]|nr:PHB depolymerase family esterase [Solirubrobacterales bacterium]